MNSTDATGNNGPSDEPGDVRDPVDEIAGQMEAASALIESLEEEVISLRRDLGEASIALKAAQEEVAARGRALEEQEQSGSDEDEIFRLRSELSDVRLRHSNEQLELRNQHINEIAKLRTDLEEQRKQDLAAASSEERFATLKEEYQREREASEERHRTEIEALKTASREWEEKLRESYREQEERHRAELEAVLREADEQREESDRSLRESFEQQVSRERKTAAENQEAALQAIRSAAAGRELELQKDYQAVVETQQAEIESLRERLAEASREAEERRNEELRDFKRVAESREKELRRAQTARLNEVTENAQRRISALQAQREADNQALRARQEEEVARLRREYEERLAAEDERRKSETWALEERVAGQKARSESETRVYTARLKELEDYRLAHQAETEANLERVVQRFGEEISDLESRVAALSDSLEESEKLRGKLEEQLAETRGRAERGELNIPREHPPEQDTGADSEISELDSRRILAEERVQALEQQLRQAREESRQNAEELEKTRESLERLTAPEHRLRSGISMFNASEHTRTVASISKALGLPQVHAGIDNGPSGKPVLTFIWGDMAWRRYVSDPTEGVEEPRIYLTGTGDEPSEVRTPEQEPNARMDAHGRLTLGIRAR